MAWNDSNSSERNAQFILYACFTVIVLAVVLSTVYYTTRRVTDSQSLTTQTQAAEATYPSLVTEVYEDTQNNFSLKFPSYYDVLEVSNSQLRLKNTEDTENSMSLILINTNAYLKKQKFEELEKRIHQHCQSTSTTLGASCALDFDSIEVISNSQETKGYTGNYTKVGEAGVSEVFKFVAFPLRASEYDLVVLLSDLPGNEDFFTIADFFETH